MEKAIIASTDVKRLNKSRIFRAIHYAEKISRQEITELLSLSLPTVNQNLKLLSDDRYIVIEGSFESTGGRKAQIISINENIRYAVSVNIKKHSLKVSIINLKGDVIAGRYEKRLFSESESYADWVSRMIKEVIDEYAIADADILGVGITLPGILDDDNRVLLSAPTMGVKNYDTSVITKKIPYEVVVMNAARSIALAEHWNRKDLAPKTQRIYLMVDEGVGGASVCTQNVVYGDSNRYGEFGHMTLYPGGRPCFCGRRGCFESYVASRRLSTDLGVTLDEFFEGVKNGNQEYRETLDTYIDNLATGINNIYIMNNMDVILCGTLAKYLKEYEEEIRNKLIKKYSFDTDASYFGFAQVDQDKAQTGVAISFVMKFISSV